MNLFTWSKYRYRNVEKCPGALNISISNISAH
jgi:hypothetical protein